MDADERKKLADYMSLHLPVMPSWVVWSDEDIEAMKAAYKCRFSEPVPMTETLLYVASIGYRRALHDARNDNPA